MKIVVPVDTDKTTIFKRTGQAPFFAIFNDSTLESFVENGHAHEGRNHGEGYEHDHDENDEEHVGHHKKDMEPLQGCDVILVQAMGEHMKEALDSLGIKIQKIRKKDGIFAHEAVANFLQNKI